MHHRRLRPAAGLLLGAVTCFLALGSCDNIGRIFDPGGGSGGGRGSNPATQIQTPPDGAIVIANRPKVLAAFPDGGNWPVTTPIVVLFNEAMNLDSIRDSSTTTPQHLFARVKAQGTTTEDPPPIDGSYDLLLGGRLLIFRPQQPFQPGATIEIFAGNAVRDIDRATLSTTGVLAEFAVDPAATVPQVVASFPRDRENSVERQTGIYTVFSLPIDSGTANESSLFVRKRGDTSSVSGKLTNPLKVGPAEDPRIFLLTPDAPLEASTGYELVYTEDITANDIKLDTGTRKPTFTTSEPLRIKSVKVQPVTVGTTTFENKINIANLSNVLLDVDLDVGSKIGDRILVRIYGVDPKTSPTDVLKFVEFEGSVTADGERTETLSLGAVLGQMGSTAVKDGELTIAARVSRGSQLTGFVSGTDALLDTVRPTFEHIGPPTAATGTNEFLTDLNAATLLGKASEELGAVELGVLGNTYGLFASGSEGEFQSLGFFLNRQVADVPFTLNIADRAGNLASGAINGVIRQRGFVTGSVSGGTLTVVAYDDATLESVSGVDVLVEPGFPKSNAAGRVTAKTDANGIATFTGLTQPKYSITLIKSGYHVFSLLNTAAGTVSLPMRPETDATATAAGQIDFTALPNFTAEVGVNLLPDAADDFRTATDKSTPTVLQNTVVRPNRPLVISGYANVYPATAKPAFLLSGHSLRKTSSTATVYPAPPAVVGPGGSYVISQKLGSPAPVNMLAPVSFDLSTAGGLDTLTLTGGKPEIHFLASLGGFAGMSLMGVGFATGSGSSFSGDGTYDLGTITGLTPLGPILWMSMQAEDGDGNIARSRALVADPNLPVGVVLAPVPGIPTVAQPSGTFTDSPEITFEDRLVAGSVASSLAIREIKAVDAQKREWVAVYVDEDGAVTAAKVQLPVLSGSGLTGLAAGGWAVSIDDALLIAPGLSASEFNLEDIRRLELSFARAKPETYTVQ